MSLLFIASTSFVIALSGALVPGPLFTITVSESMKRGFWAGPLIILGHGILELTFVLLLFLGIMPYLGGESAKTAIAIVGGFLLVVMGVLLLRDARGMRLDLSPVRDRRGMHPVLSGIVLSLSNPYWIVWWTTVGLGYLVGSQQQGVPGVIAFFSGHISADLLWYSLLSLGVSKGRAVIGPAGYRYVLAVCGVFLVLFGGWFILKGGLPA